MQDNPTASLVSPLIIDAGESLERALADVEMVHSAFEQEVDAARNTENHSSFPLHVTLQFSRTASCCLEWNLGYPVTSKLQIASSRSSSLPEKLRLEHALSVLRQHAQDALEDQVEAGLTCCSAALEAWNDYIPPADAIGVTENESLLPDNESSSVTTIPQHAASLRQYPWKSGEPLRDRKSTFQAHLTPIVSDADVQPALSQLLWSNNKLQKATHNMYAWRVCHNEIWKHDNDDDGEDAAGSRLAHLLSVRNEDGVFIVVSRWFGGIHLGPKRFAHITNVARELLDAHRVERQESAA